MGLVCLIHVVIYDNIECEDLRWIQGEFMEFSTFPKWAQFICLTALATTFGSYMHFRRNLHKVSRLQDVKSI